MARIVASFTLAVAVERRAAAADAPLQPSMGAADLVQAEQRAALCSASNLSGTGLRGEYFAGRKPEGVPLLVRIDSTVDFDASFDLPASATARHVRSARWNGWVKVPISGRYRFGIAHQAVTLVVARQQLIGKEAPADAAIALTAGRFYPVDLQVEQLDTLSGRLALEWTTPFGARYVVPRALLFVPTAS